VSDNNIYIEFCDLQIYISFLSSLDLTFQSMSFDKGNLFDAAVVVSPTFESKSMAYLTLPEFNGIPSNGESITILEFAISKVGFFTLKLAISLVIKLAPLTIAGKKFITVSLINFES
jgi:hypothetical protein